MAENGGSKFHDYMNVQSFFVSMTHCRVTIVVFYIWLLTPFSVHDAMSCAGHILPRQAATPRLQQGPGSKRGGRAIKV